MTRKSRFITFILSIFPGVGHLYLGLNKRGLQFMIGAAACIILMAHLPLIFPFVLAILWFYSLFDALQKAQLLNAYMIERNRQQNEVVDTPSTADFVSKLDATIAPLQNMTSQKKVDPIWIGAGLVLLGVLVLIDLMFPELWRTLANLNIGTILLAVVMIGFGIWLIRHQVKS